MIGQCVGGGLGQDEKLTLIFIFIIRSMQKDHSQIGK